MTGLSTALRSDDLTPGQILHEARIRHNPPAERPRGVPPWGERAPWQQDLDEEMAADLAAVVEAQVRGRIAADLMRLAMGAAPMIERDVWLAARQAALHGLAKRSDEKEPQP